MSWMYLSLLSLPRKLSACDGVLFSGSGTEERTREERGAEDGEEGEGDDADGK